MSLVPVCSSLAARPIAASDEAQAASTVKLVPPKSSRLAIRPGGDVHQHPGEAVLGPLRQPVEELLLEARMVVRCSDGSAERTV